MSSSLDQLKKMTVVVVDSGDIDALKSLGAQDATTNPSLIYQACQKPQYQSLVKDALSYCQQKGVIGTEKENLLIDKLLVNFGCEILKFVPGRVSTEVDAKLSFDSEESVKRAERLIALYQEAGIPSNRILIKLASTWEGAQAASTLEKKGIHCNMTLMFSLAQAKACAQAGATLISPFVGRILDWYKKNQTFNGPSSEDPGVLSVKEIFSFYKEHGISTEVMGASFRNAGEILELAGCDLLTISPALLDELGKMQQPVSQKLFKPSMPPKKNLQPLDEPTFRWEFNQNPMAVDKLAEGIRNFAADTDRLIQLIRK